MPYCGVDHGYVSLSCFPSLRSHTARCDSINLDGTTKPCTQERGSYGHAQKMRAAVTYAFGRLQGLGNMPWHESEFCRGEMRGNPSVSVEVSSYMCSLRRRKVFFFLVVSLVRYCLTHGTCFSTGSGGGSRR